MPRPQHPPTPASSTEIKSKDGSRYPTLQMSFELPPPAIVAGKPGTQPSSVSSRTSSTSSYHPASPTSPANASEAVKTRRRSSVAATAPAKDVFALPPPPTRSRKIIQMKPRGQAADETEEAIDESPKSSNAKATAASKKKAPSSTSVAGRKIARKTAHSLIERRRRSKMNEEFGVLKDMIPACNGEMHKLAILQASIDYIRYLEDCVSKLKVENTRTHTTSTNPSSEQFMLPPPANLPAYTPRQYQPEEQEDIEMEGGSDEHPSPANTIPAPNSARPSMSPAILPQDRHNSYSSSNSNEHRHYSFSSTTSPALLPDLGRGLAHFAGSALTSPALQPQRDRDLDQEATAALMMLNCDRRGMNSGARGMSVKDLLSS